MGNVLLLNATYEPLRVIALKRAVVLVLMDKAEVLEAREDRLRSAGGETYATPAVIRLKYFVKIPYTARLPLNRKAVLMRDRHECCYCGGKASTIDHVQPRSRGGRHRWENVVAACGPCNARKDDKLLSELGWKMRYRPHVPTGTRWLIIGVVEPDPAWEPYLAVA
jgi:5-methylcytosine-specific restriction endonuclease McrA